MTSTMRVLLVLPMILAMAGCETAGRTGTVAEVRELSGGKVLLNSPDVRAVWQTEVGRDSQHGKIHPRVISCVEPSADVAKVVGNSFNLGASLSAKLPEGVTPEIAGAIASAQAGAMAQLGERLATIQLLRDGLFRACEAFANGALSDISYAVMLSRYDDTMVTLLASEIAGGAFGRTLAAASTEAGGSAKAALDITEKREQTRDAERTLETKRNEQRDTERKLDEKRNESRDAERQLNQKRSEVVTKDGELTKSKLAEGDLQRAVAAGGANAAQRKSELAQKQKETRQLEAELSQTQKEASKLESDVSRLQKESQQLEATLNQKDKEVTRSVEDVNRKLTAEAQANAKSAAIAGGGITRLQDKDVANTIAGIQRKYLENINSDSLVVACLVAMDRRYEHTATRLQDACPRFLDKVIENQGNRLETVLKDANARTKGVVDVTDVTHAAKTLKEAADQIKGLKSNLP